MIGGLGQSYHNAENSVSNTAKSVSNFTQSTPQRIQNFAKPIENKVNGYVKNTVIPDFQQNVYTPIKKKVVAPVVDWSKRSNNFVQNTASKIGQEGLDKVTGKKNILPTVDYSNKFMDAPKTNVAKGVYNLGAGIVNSVASEGIVRPANDVVENTARVAMGKPIKSHDELKSGAMKIGYDLMGKGAKNTQGVLGDVSQTVSPIIDAFGGGKVVSATTKGFKTLAAKQLAKQSAKTGAKLGLMSGVAQGLKDNQDKSLAGQLGSAAISGVIGAGAGAGLGYALPLAGAGVKNVIDDAKIFANPKTITNSAKKYVNTGSFISSDGNYPKMVDPNYFQPKSLLFKGIMATEGKPAGLSIKDIKAGGRTFPDAIAAKTEKAKVLINNQIQNQKAGLPKAEPGFIAPQNLPEPQNKPQAMPSIEEYVNGNQSIKKPLASIGEFVDGKQAKASPIDRELEKINPKWHTDYKMVKDDMSKAIKDEADYMMSLKDEVGGVGTYKKIGEGEIGGDMGLRRFSSNPQWYRDFFDKNGRAPAKWEVAKIAEENLKNGNGINAEKYNSLKSIMTDIQQESAKVAEPTLIYNKFQQRAFDKKKERIDAISDVINYPSKLRTIGYRKNEIDRIGKDQAGRILKLSGLGYPKNEIQKFDFDRMDLIIKNNVPWSSLKGYYERKHALDTHYLDDIDPETLKDIAPINSGMRDVYRNFEATFGESFPKLKTRLLDPFDQAKGVFIQEQKNMLRELEENVVKKLGIEKGSNLSQYVQKYGENKFIKPLEETDIPDAIKRQIDLPALQSLAEKTKGDWRILVEKKLDQMPNEKKQIVLSQLQQIEPQKWQNVVQADNWFREKYSSLLDELNQVREANFPTHPLFPESSKVIPKRNDYYRHFQEISEGFSGLKNLFDTPASIDPALAVSSEFTKPKAKWLSFAQKRTGDKTEYDAVGGFLDYLKSHAYAKNIDPFIQKFRGVDTEAEKKAGQVFFHKTRGLAEELSQKLDPVQQITDSTDPTAIKKILIGHDISDQQADWMSKELAGNADYDKVAGFLKQKLAKNAGNPFAKMVPEAPGEKSDNQLNNFLKFVDNFSNDLAGKTNPFDRPVQDLVGRKAFKALNWFNSRVKANAILGNLSSAVAQAGNIPQGIASAGVKNSFKGMRDTLAGIYHENPAMKSSAFINERYFKDYAKFDTGILNDTKKMAVWITGALDEAGTKLIWNSHYQKAIGEGIPNAAKYADDLTRRMVAGRGIGEVPILQKAKVMQLIAPFQLEVQNLWHVFNDWKIEGKLFPKFLKFAVASYLFNSVAETVRGSRVGLDPINAGVEAVKSYQQEDNKGKGAVMAGGRIIGEGLKNIIGGQSVANLVGEQGGLLGIPTPTRKQLFGEGDPTRFGTGGIMDFATKGSQDPLFKVIPPFGGAQIKKTIEGTKSLIDGYVKNTAGNVMTPVDKNIPNIMRGVMFGKNSFGEMRDYFDNKQTPLSKEQTEKFKIAGNGYFDSVMASRTADNEKATLKKASESGKTLEGPGVVGNGIHRLADGNFYVPGLLADTKTFKTEKLANYAIDREDFMNSEDKTREHEGNFWYKDANGDFKTKTVAARQRDLDKAKSNLDMDRAQAKDDMNAWVDAANKKISAIENYAKTLDPAIDQDEIDSLTLEKENLLDKAEKYADQGGFKKGKKLAEKFRYNLVDPEMLRINNIIAGMGGNKFKMIRRPLPLVRRRLPVVRRTRRA